MKKKLAWILAFLMVLVTVCAIAVAEDEKMYTVNLGGGQDTRRALQATDKAALKPARGSTINTFIFNRVDDWDIIRFYNGDFIDLKTGKYINKVSLSCYGTPNIKVESGSKWLSVEKDYHYGGTYSFDIIAETNDYSTTKRQGTVVISDSKGVVLRIKITQSSDVWIKSAKQLDGSAHDREVRVQTTRVQGVGGKVIYYESYEPTEPCGDCFWCELDPSYCYYIYTPTDFYSVKYTKGNIWFHKNRAVDLCHAYHVGMYKVIAGRKRLGGGTDFILQHDGYYDEYYYAEVNLTH